MRAERRASRDSMAQGSDFSSLRPTLGALMLLSVMRLSVPAHPNNPQIQYCGVNQLPPAWLCHEQRLTCNRHQCLCLCLGLDTSFRPG